ncbi:ice-binding family protein [Flavobacterium sp. W20_MBD1_R3]|uniref:ice-binding family protein n=1 Tax=Flavobacterium sp. W20_MBD1_R3 TaxID=3240278 RepID=UPI003F912046
METIKNVIKILLLTISLNCAAQIGLGTANPDASSILDLASTTKGLLVPRMSLEERNLIASPAEGLLIFNTTTKGFNYFQSGWNDYLSNYKTVTANTDVTTISTTDEAIEGSVLTTSSGSYAVSFNSQYKNEPITTTTTVTTPGIVTINTVGCFAALTTAIAQLDAITVTNSTHSNIIGIGETITPGKYAIPAAITLAGNLTLDAQGNSDALFIFAANGAINSVVGTSITLTGGAKACNVFWLAAGGIGIGADCIIKGNLISRTAAIAVGFRSELEGRMLSGGGAIAFGPGTAGVPLGTSSIDLGIVAPFIIYTHAGGLGNVIDGANTTSIYNGFILSDAGAATGFETGTLSNPIIPAGGTATYGSGSETSVTTTTVVENDVKAIATFSIYQNGIIIPESTRSVTSNASTISISLQGIATILDGESIDVRWSTNGSKISLGKRTLTIIKVR